MMGANRKIFVTIIVAMTGLASLHAQNNLTVRGNLKSQTGEPVPFANVALCDSLGNLVTGTASDVNGDFTLSGIKEGLFKIEIQFVGYDTWRQNNVSINRDINLGKRPISTMSLRRVKHKEKTMRAMQSTVAWQNLFLDDKIRISISARDIFNTRRYGGTSYGDGFFQERSFKPEFRLVFMSLALKI